MKVTATPVLGRDLLPGDLFSVRGPEYWSQIDARLSIGESVYIRTNAPSDGAPDPGEPVFRITIETMDTTQHDIGSAPNQEEYRHRMVAVAKELDRVFNASATGPNRKVGFVLLVFPFGEGEGRCNYISNGAAREDIIRLLREQANRFDHQTQ